MKTLLLMRHAKSSWDDLFCSDHDRKLSDRGRAAAPLMGRWLAENNLNADAVLLSSATRVLETWDLVQNEWGATVPVRLDKTLYMSGPGQLWQAITRTGQGVNILLVINHEPGLSLLTENLARPPVAPAPARAFTKFPTAAIAELRFDATNWQNLTPHSASFTRFIRPKDLSEPKP